jgi:YebC/PmpR family DNA-binding regulatory protein
MAGHNKWSKIKHKKGAADAKRSKVWTKIIREITISAKMGGEDPGCNPRLRKAIDDARGANMPKDNVTRAISKASTTDTSTLEELVYEGYGPGGVAIIVECLTDNRNRTGSDVRTIIQKKGGNLGTPGSVMFGFQKKGQIFVEKKAGVSDEKLLEAGLEHGIEDVAEEDEGFLITCAPENYLPLKDALEAAKFEISDAEVTLVPDNQIKVSGDNAQKLIAMIENLEDNDDVQNVYTNMDIDDAELEQLAS